MLTSILDQCARILYVHQELPDRSYAYFYNLVLRTILEMADDMQDDLIGAIVQRLRHNSVAYNLLLKNLQAYESKWCRFNSAMSVDSVIENHLITAEESCRNMNPDSFQKLIDLLQSDALRNICGRVVNG